MRFMYGRYGADALYKFLFGVALAIAIINIFIGSISLWFLESVLIALAMFRCFSRNICKRQAENARYLKFTTRIRQFLKRQINRVKYRKTKVYKKCPSCKSILCLPRKKGQHSVKCPSCSNRFDVKI